MIILPKSHVKEPYKIFMYVEGRDSKKETKISGTKHDDTFLHVNEPIRVKLEYLTRL